MPVQAIASAAADEPPRVHLGRNHPVATVAAAHCRKHDMPRPRIGGVACGKCWELAIRDDERIVVECGLPRDLTRDRSLVDSLAVELAVSGRKVKLTKDERAQVKRVRTADRSGRSLTMLTCTWEQVSS